MFPLTPFSGRSRARRASLGGGVVERGANHHVCIFSRDDETKMMVKVACGERGEGEGGGGSCNAFEARYQK